MGRKTSQGRNVQKGDDVNNTRNSNVSKLGKKERKAMLESKKSPLEGVTGTERSSNTPGQVTKDHVFLRGVDPQRVGKRHKEGFFIKI